MKRFALLALLTCAVFAFVASSSVSASTDPKSEARAAAISFLDAWKAKDAKALCKSLFTDKQLAAKNSPLSSCTTQMKAQFKSGALPGILGYSIQQVELFRKGQDAFVDVALTLSTGVKPLYLYFKKADGQYVFLKIIS